MFKDKTLQAFVDQTASNEPTPGGGSIAATNGAIAYSLTQMVANLSIGKEKYVAVEDQMKQLVEKTEHLRQELLVDIDRDASSFDEVMKAFKLPKSTDEEKKARSKKIQEGYKYAASIPLGVAKKIVESMDLIEFVVEHGNKNAVTDGLVAMMNARTGCLAALLNVKINLGSIKDQEFVSDYKTQIDSLENEAISRETALLNSITL
jgi:formiminotetrahydrofolate cyclodeaminase